MQLLENPWPDLPEELAHLHGRDLLEAAAAVRDGDEAQLAYVRAAAAFDWYRWDLQALADEARDKVLVRLEELNALRHSQASHPALTKAAKALLAAEHECAVAARACRPHAELASGYHGKATAAWRDLPRRPVIPTTVRACRIAYDLKRYQDQREALGDLADGPRVDAHTLQTCESYWSNVLRGRGVILTRLAEFPADRKHQQDREAHELHLARLEVMIETGADPGLEGLPNIDSFPPALPPGGGVPLASGTIVTSEGGNRRPSGLILDRVAYMRSDPELAKAGPRAR